MWGYLVIPRSSQVLDLLSNQIYGPASKYIQHLSQADWLYSAKSAKWWPSVKKVDPGKWKTLLDWLGGQPPNFLCDLQWESATPMVPPIIPSQGGYPGLALSPKDLSNFGLLRLVLWAKLWKVNLFHFYIAFPFAQTWRAGKSIIQFDDFPS